MAALNIAPFPDHAVRHQLGDRRLGTAKVAITPAVLKTYSRLTGMAAGEFDTALGFGAVSPCHGPVRFA
jgi:hypothetical protein